MERYLGRYGYLDLGLGSRKVWCGTPGKVHRRVGVGRSDGGHESNSSCQTITKIPSACRIKAVFVMGIDKCVKVAQNHNTILEALQEHTGDQVVKIVDSWSQYRSMSPERKMLVRVGHSL